MKCVICGSRDITDYDLIKMAIEESGFEITEVVSGGARGVDVLGEKWAAENNVKITRMIPDWDKYGKRAGFLRNKDMVEYVMPDGCVIAIWDGISRGTPHTINLAKENNLKLYLKKVQGDSI